MAVAAAADAMSPIRGGSLVDAPARQQAAAGVAAAVAAVHSARRAREANQADVNERNIIDGGRRERRPSNVQNLDREPVRSRRRQQPVPQAAPAPPVAAVAVAPARAQDAKESEAKGIEEAMGAIGAADVDRDQVDLADEILAQPPGGAVGVPPVGAGARQPPRQAVRRNGGLASARLFADDDNSDSDAETVVTVAGRGRRSDDKKTVFDVKIAAKVIGSVQQSGGARRWVDTRQFRGARNRMEVFHLACALDALLNAGVDTTSLGVEIICRRMYAVAEADKHNNWAIADVLSLESSSGSLVDRDFELLVMSSANKYDKAAKTFDRANGAGNQQYRAAAPASARGGRSYQGKSGGFARGYGDRQNASPYQTASQ